MKKALFIILAIICFASPFFSWIPSIVNSIQFSANCGQNLDWQDETRTPQNDEVRE